MPATMFYAIGIGLSIIVLFWSLFAINRGISRCSRCGEYWPECECKGRCVDEYA